MKDPCFGLLLVLAVVLTGCAETGGGPPVTVRDSSGVQVVESLRPQWVDGEAWRVRAEPLLRIGVVEGDVAYQFDGVTGAARLSDGTLVVADAGYQEIRFFDGDGRWRTTFGRPGGGPGEFTALTGMGVDPIGGVWAYDFMLRRLTWLSSAGEMTGLTTLDPEPPTLHPLGVLPDGSFLLKELWGKTPDAEENTMGLRRDPVAYVRFDVEGTMVDTVGLFPGRQIFITEDETGRDIMGTPPFARNSVGAIWGGGFVQGASEDFELREHLPEGEVSRILRVSGPDRSLGPDNREEYVRGRLEGMPPERRPGARADLEAMPFPETRPAYGAFLGDETGNLWVGEWSLYPRVPERWTVLDPSGKWLGDVVVPSGFFPYHIGDDWILGVERDDLEVEYVVLYPLVK